MPIFTKTTVGFAAILTLFFAAGCTNESSISSIESTKEITPKHLLVEVPGTGVSLIPPTNTELYPAGPFLNDSKFESIISVIVKPDNKNSNDIDTFKKVYPHFVRKIKIDSQEGELYKRTRKVDGGGYDGWWFVLNKDNKILQVNAFYTGNNYDSFQSMESMFSTILWESGNEDNFLSFGYKTSVDGLSDISKAIGNLNFGDRTSTDSLVTLDIMAFPMPREKIGDPIVFCNKFVTQIFIDELRSGPTILQKNGFELWEMTGHTKFNKSGTVDYIAFLQTPEKGFIQVNGKAPESSMGKWEKRFREALFQMKRVR